VSCQMSYIEAIREAHRQEMRRDESVVLLGIDVGPLGGLFGTTKTLHAEFGPTRVLEFPISETGYIGAGIGLAIEGFRPVIEIQMADFVTVALDQVMTVVSKEYAVTGGASSLPLVIRLPYGANLTGQGYMGGAGPAHSQSHEAWFCHSPGLTVVMPSSPADALGLLKAAVRSPDPVIFMEQKGLYYAIEAEVPDGDHVVNIGEARVAVEGADATIVALGAMVHVAERVAEILAREDGASVEVIDPRTLVPLDERTILDSVRKTGRLVVAHEAHRTGGFGAEIAAIAAEKAFGDLMAPVLRCAARDVAIPAGAAALRVLPGVADLTATVRRVLGWTYPGWARAGGRCGGRTHTGRRARRRGHAVREFAGSSPDRRGQSAPPRDRHGCLGRNTRAGKGCAYRHRRAACARQAARRRWRGWRRGNCGLPFFPRSRWRAPCARHRRRTIAT